MVDRILVLLNAYSSFQNLVNPQIIQRFTSNASTFCKNLGFSSEILFFQKKKKIILVAFILIVVLENQKMVIFYKFLVSY